MVCALFGLILTSGCGPAEVARAEKAPVQKARVAVKQPTTLRMNRDVELSGEFRAWQQADLHAKIAGYLRQLTVDIGSRVSAGQTIAVLDAPELIAEQSEVAAAVQRAESEELHAAAALKRAQAQATLAGAALERLNAVNQKEKGLVAGQELDEARARQGAAEADVASAEAALQSARKGIEAAKARLVRVEAMLSYTRITAPFAGVVIRRYVDPGTMVQAGTASSTQAMPVIQLASTDKLRLTVVIPESIVPDIRIGTPVTVKVPSLGQTFNAKVSRFTDNVTSSSRTMEAQVDVANPKGLISPGMIAEISIQTTGTRDVMAIPVQAISRRGGQSYVLAVDSGGKVEEKRIEAGLETASHIEVVAGLNRNDHVIVGARTLVQPGDVVDVQQESTN